VDGWMGEWVNAWMGGWVGSGLEQSSQLSAIRYLLSAIR
jgi:hypothetical protein